MKSASTNKLNDKISLYTLSKTLDDYGQTAMSYTLYRANVASKASIKSSREDSLTNKRVSSYEYEFILRENQPITSDMIILYDGKYLSIYGIEDARHDLHRRKLVKAYYNEDNQGIIE